MRKLQLVGRRFGRLVVLEETRNKNNKIRWYCRCDCGKETYVIGSHLISGHTISCGCAGLEHATRAKLKHGDALFRCKNRLYQIWAAMRRRCYNENCDAYPYYGGKGIQVCQSWRDYVKFKAWALKNGYAENLTIDRIDPEKDYTPSNCQWITKEENIARAKMLPQAIKDKAFEFLAQGKQYKDICTELNISVVTLREWRIQRKLPVRSPYPQAMIDLVLCLRKEGMRTVDILEISGIGESTFHQWVKNAS